MDGPALPMPSICISRRLRWRCSWCKYAILCCIAHTSNYNRANDVAVRILMNRWFFHIFGIHTLNATATLLNIWICMQWTCSWRWWWGRIGLCTHGITTQVMLWVSLWARRDTTQVMLGVSLRARWDTTLVYLKELEKNHKPANKSSPRLLKWLILINSACHSEINDIELGQCRSCSGSSVDTTKSSNRTRTVRGRSIFISCERKPDSSERQE